MAQNPKEKTTERLDNITPAFQAGDPGSKSLFLLEREKPSGKRELLLGSENPGRRITIFSFAKEKLGTTNLRNSLNQRSPKENILILMKQTFRMKLGILFSGGKDSIMALDWAIENYSASCLISLKSKNPNSYMFHTPNINLVEQQAKELELPLIFHKTHGRKEEELKDLKGAVEEAVKKYKIEGLVAGALASKYQKERVKKICNELDIKCFTPYWHHNEEDYIELILKKGYKVIITGVSAEGLGKEFLGKEITSEVLDKLKNLKDKYRLHIAGEGGEYETFVYDGPIFKKPLRIKSYEIKWEGDSGEFLIKDLI